MSTLYPHSVADLALAPVLIEIERNLNRLRTNRDLQFSLALTLNDDESRYLNPAERADRIARCVTQNVDLHGWQVRPTADLDGLAVTHGEYEVSLMLGGRLTDYVGR